MTQDDPSSPFPSARLSGYHSFPLPSTKCPQWWEFATEGDGLWVGSALTGRWFSWACAPEFSVQVCMACRLSFWKRSFLCRHLCVPLGWVLGPPRQWGLTRLCSPMAQAALVAICSASGTESPGLSLGQRVGSSEQALTVRLQGTSIKRTLYKN